MSKGIMLRATDEEIQFFEKGNGLAKGGLSAIVEENHITKKALEHLLSEFTSLTARVEILAKTPEPARGVKRLSAGVRVINKGEDGTVSFETQVQTQPSPGTPQEALARAVDALPPEERL